MSRFKNECPRCISLGTFEEYDLYYCRGGLEGETVLARFGDGGQYSSGLGSNIPALKEAERRLRLAGADAIAGALDTKAEPFDNDPNGEAEPRKPVTLDERAVAALERIAIALGASNYQLESVVQRLGWIDKSIEDAGGQS